MDNTTTEQQLRYEMQMAIYKESVIRESAFLPITLDIGGIPVKQYTMRHHLLLDFANNPFVKGNEIFDKEHILEFMWIVSCAFKYGSSEAKSKFLIDVACKYDSDEKAVLLVKEILEYLTNAFIDNSDVEVTKGASIPIVSWIATYIHAVASIYGWSDEYIMDLPMNRVCQYVRCIERDLAIKSGTEPIFRNKLSDKAKVNWLKFLQDKSNGGVVLEGDKILTMENAI